MRLIGHSDQGGRPDGVQLMVHRGFAYIGHMVSQGFSVVDVRDPTRPTTVNYIAAPPGTWNVHLQAHDDLLLVINARDLFADARFADEKVYYTRSVGDTVSDVQDRGWSAGLRIFDISTPAQPREISFLSLNGIGIHRGFGTMPKSSFSCCLLFITICPLVSMVMCWASVLYRACQSITSCRLFSFCSGVSATPSGHFPSSTAVARR